MAARLAFVFRFFVVAQFACKWYVAGDSADDDEFEDFDDVSAQANSEGDAEDADNWDVDGEDPNADEDGLGADDLFGDMEEEEAELDGDYDGKGGDGKGKGAGDDGDYGDYGGKGGAGKGKGKGSKTPLTVSDVEEFVSFAGKGGKISLKQFHGLIDGENFDGPAEPFSAAEKKEIARAKKELTITFKEADTNKDRFLDAEEIMANEDLKQFLLDNEGGSDEEGNNAEDYEGEEDGEGGDGEWQVEEAEQADDSGDDDLIYLLENDPEFADEPATHEEL